MNHRLTRLLIQRCHILRKNDDGEYCMIQENVPCISKYITDTNSTDILNNINKQLKEFLFPIGIAIKKGDLIQEVSTALQWRVFGKSKLFKGNKLEYQSLVTEEVLLKL